MQIFFTVDVGHC